MGWEGKGKEGKGGKRRGAEKTPMNVSLLRA